MWNREKLWQIRPLLSMIAMAVFGVFLTVFVFGLFWTWSPFPDTWIKLISSHPWTLITGLAAAPSLLLMWYWRDKNRRQDIANHKEDQRIEKCRQYSERYARAIELLDSKKMSTRLGAIYSLEAIANESVDHHWMVMETLMAFVTRESKPQPPHGEGYVIGISEQTSDVLSALKVIRRRKHFRSEKQDQYFDLSWSHLKRAIFNNGHFRNANFNLADLEVADFENADLRGAQFQNAKLESVNFRGAKLDNALFINAFYNSQKTNYFPPTCWPEGFDPEDHGMINVSKETLDTEGGGQS